APDPGGADRVRRGRAARHAHRAAAMRAETAEKQEPAEGDEPRRPERPDPRGTKKRLGQEREGKKRHERTEVRGAVEEVRVLGGGAVAAGIPGLDQRRI